MRTLRGLPKATFALWALLPVIVFAVAMRVPAPARAAAEPADAELAAQAAALKSIQVRFNSQGAQAKRIKKAEHTRAILRALRDGTPLPESPFKARRVTPEDFPLRGSTAAERMASGFSLGAVTAIPANVRANDPTGDSPNSGQAEQAIASYGPNVLVAWNDGEGFVTVPHVQGYGYSTDGGATFTDGGSFPVPGGSPNWTWEADPVVTVNEATGEFWYCGLISPSNATNGIGVVRGTFAGGVINWDTPVAAVSVSNVMNFTDKQWMVADSSNGNLYMSYTDFYPGNNAIRFIRSTDGGVTWSTPIAMNGPSASNRVQGSRPVVGPDGEVYVVWKEIGTVDVDFMRIRKSTDQGVSFGPEQTAVSYYDNFGTGAPGFNRERAVSFPSVAVDRTTGPNRGRIYLAYHESYNFYNDFILLNSGTAETEPNNTSGAANAFTIGNTVRGSLAAGDQDWFSFPATAGTHYMFWCDSLASQFYSLRVFCTDGIQRLAFTGDLVSPAGGTSFFTWTAPANGVYFLRMFWVSGGSNGGYRIRTAIGNRVAERGRDQRDVFVTYSDDGTSWSGPVRVNNDVALYDDWLPEVGVGSDGCPYVMWFDWRDAAAGCAGLSHIYVARSGNGGNSWSANLRATDVPSDWTASFSNIAPNQGDYSHMYGADDFMRWTWADGRGVDPDVYVTGVDTRHAIAACQPNTFAEPNYQFLAHVEVQNPNLLFANNYTYTVTDERGWPISGGNLTVAEGATAGFDAPIAVPDTAAPGTNPVCINVFNDKMTRVEQCCFVVTVVPNLGVGDGELAFGLRPVSPNPARGIARIAFTLPARGDVRLRVYGLQGELVRTLADGERGAGLHSIAWDGRDERGLRVGAGTYFIRLEGLGQSASRRFVWVR